MIIAPLFAIYLALTLKLTYSSENEIINSGRVIEKSVKKNYINEILLYYISTASCNDVCVFNIHI